MTEQGDESNVDETLCDPKRFEATTALAEMLMTHLEAMGRKGAEMLFTRVEDGATLIKIHDQGIDLNTGTVWFQVYAPLTGELRRITIELEDDTSEKLAQLGWEVSHG